MRIGIPRALLYYRYSELWKSFFEYLEIDYVVSSNTNRIILKKGIKNSIDEACLSAKIFMGHVENIINRCDYIFVPRIVSFGEGEEMCPKFNGLLDIVRNTFPKVKVLTYNVDENNKKSEKKAFLNLGLELGFKRRKILNSYKTALVDYELDHKLKVKKQELLLRQNGIKVLIVAHPYNIYDNLVGKPIIKMLEQLKVLPIYADLVNRNEAIKRSKKLTRSLPWTFNKELVGGIELFQNKVDGIILISSFPCGPDSLVNEQVMRKVKDISITNIVIDELDGNAGVQTRIESFIDVIKLKKEGSLNE